jgi:hypothetical protein
MEPLRVPGRDAGEEERLITDRTEEAEDFVCSTIEVLAASSVAAWLRRSVSSFAARLLISFFFPVCFSVASVVHLSVV